MHTSWMDTIFIRSWTAPFRARFYLSRQGLPITRDAIAQRQQEEAVMYATLRETLNNKSSRAESMELRYTCVGFRPEDLKAAFDNGSEKFYLSAIECVDYSIAFQKLLVEAFEQYEEQGIAEKVRQKKLSAKTSSPSRRSKVKKKQALDEDGDSDAGEGDEETPPQDQTPTFSRAGRQIKRPKP